MAFKYAKAPSNKVRFAPGPFTKPNQGKGGGKGGDEDTACMVFVGNLPFSVRWQDLKDHMAQAGAVAFSRVLTEDGTDFGRSRGCGVVRYETRQEAQQAMAMLGESTLGDRQITCDAWTGHAGAGKKQLQGMDIHGDPAKVVYVGNLPYEVKWQDLKDHMAQAGTVEFCNVLTEDGSDWGRSKGTGCVRYATAAEANAAVVSLNESVLSGRFGPRNLLVDHWVAGESEAGAKHSVAGGKAKGKGKGKVVKPWTGSPSVGKSAGKGGVQGLGFDGDPARIIYVGNLSFKTRWQELKDHMSQAGVVEFCKVLTDDGSDWGRSKGTGCVRYATTGEANAAIVTLNESDLDGRNLLIDHWSGEGKGGKAKGKGKGKGSWLMQT